MQDRTWKAGGDYLREKPLVCLSVGAEDIGG